MALTWTAKDAGDVTRYVWTPVLDDGDSLSAFTASAAGATIDSISREDNGIVIVVSGGIVGQTATMSLSATTSQGETLTETIYLPIRATTNTLANTGRDIVAFALRKVTGGDMDAEQLEDGMERLSDMLASWSRQGADIGVAWPVGENMAIVADDAVISAVKNNLILHLMDRYEFTPSPFVVEEARRGLQLVKASLLPDDRGAVESF